MGNGNSTSAKSKGHHGQRTKVGYRELLAQHVPRTKTEPVVVVGFPTDEGTLRLKGHSEQQQQQQQQQYGKKSSSLDSDDTFTEFIRHAKYKIRSFSNIGREQSNPTPAPEKTNNNENQKDQFDDFIQVAKKKLKTTSRVGKNSSFRG